MYRQIINSVTLEVFTDVILRTSDGANIPCVSDNRDYQDYLAWVAEGNAILPPQE